MNIQELAKHYLNQFTRKTCEDGTKFYSVPNREENEQLLDLCYRAHDGMLPDDWKYQFIVDSLERISEMDPTEELDLVNAEIEPDTVNRDLLDWLSSHGERQGYCDEAVSIYGIDANRGIMERIALGQLYEREEVFNIVTETLREQTENA